ncbi:MAG TPA: DUF2292 domain-containing protein [Methylomirabilota bacterium]|nr:DUF2292 domain-containing protein [Methylomirabilota bacterium]
MKDYSTKQISKKLVEEVVKALQNIRGWGSVEIFVQDSEVVQIIERNIKKTTEHRSLQVKEATLSTMKTGA